MKNYVKPELFFESYELSQNIAACGWDMVDSGDRAFNDPKKCYAMGNPVFGNPDIVVFTQAAQCETIWEGYCYENSADNVTIKIFNS